MKITYGCISTSHSMIKSIVSSYIHNICVSHYDIVKELVLLVKYADRYEMWELNLSYYEQILVQLPQPS